MAEPAETAPRERAARDDRRDDVRDERRSDALHSIEQALGIPPGLLAQLLAADDWSCVMALQAMLEASLGSMLAAGDAGVARLAAKLPLGGAAASKLGVADALDLADDRALRFVRQLAELRMRLATNLDALHTDLRAEVAALPPARRRWLLDGYWAPLADNDPLAAPWRERCFADEPRLVLLLGTCAAMARLAGPPTDDASRNAPLATVERAARELLEGNGFDR